MFSNVLLLYFHLRNGVIFRYQKIFLSSFFYHDLYFCKLNGGGGVTFFSYAKRTCNSRKRVPSLPRSYGPLWKMWPIFFYRKPLAWIILMWHLTTKQSSCKCICTKNICLIVIFHLFFSHFTRFTVVNRCAICNDLWNNCWPTNMYLNALCKVKLIRQNQDNYKLKRVHHSMQKTLWKMYLWQG